LKPKTIIARKGHFRSGVDRLQIPVNALKVGMTVVELDRPWSETPFVFQGFRIDHVEQIEELAQYCEHVVVEYNVDQWVPSQERQVIGKPLRRRTFEYHAPARGDYGRADVLYNESRALSRSIMDDVRLGRAIDIKEVKTTVSHAVKTILESPDAVLWLSKIRSRSEYTAEHSVNVGLLAINFGRHLGYEEEDLNRIGLCGMLHDVGKALTPLEVLHKEGALTIDEFEVMRRHTTDGRDILMSHPDVIHGAVDVAYSHHESLDGTGYPRKLKSAGISEITRIVTICDVYDAITADRCYRKGQSSLRAFEVLNREAGVKFDKRLVEEFVACIGLYPTGSLVELRNSAHGIVVSTNYRNHHLPRVLMVRDQDRQPCEERIVDLQKASGQEGREGWLIRNVVPNGTLGVRVEEYVRRGLQIQ
jgi:HD-GYP domain-containing protein (c-di-GMP phosphodiesterase class II)